MFSAIYLKLFLPFWIIPHYWKYDDKEATVNNHIDAIENLILVKEIEKEDVNLKVYDRPNSPEESIYETGVTNILDAQTSENDSISHLNFTYSPAEKKVSVRAKTRTRKILGYSRIGFYSFWYINILSLGNKNIEL